MSEIHFKKGDFITHINNSKSFAIYCGEKLPPLTKFGDYDYTLMAYYNPSHCVKNEKTNTWSVKNIFDADIDGKRCKYTITEKDAYWWRKCTENEKINALRYMANTERVAWDDETLSLRRMEAGETFQLGQPFNDTHQAMMKRETKRNRHKNKNFVERNVGVTVTVTRVIPDDYKQSKKIKGETSKMVASLTKAAKAENKRSERYYNSYSRGQQFFLGDDFGYGRCWPEFDIYD